MELLEWGELLHRIVVDPRYLANQDWGESRPGHPEATAFNHIAELEENLDKLRSKLSIVDSWKLQILIHVHDTFKKDAKQGVPITDPASHATLARKFLAEFCADTDLLNMVQFHDEPYALWRQADTKKGKYSVERFNALLALIKDWNLFLAFNIIDGCTRGKSRDPLLWLFKEVEGKVVSSFTEADIL